MRKAMMTGLLAAALAAPVQAQPSDTVEADLRCVAILSAASNNAEGEMRSQMIAAVMYFIGRIDGAAPETDLKTELKRIIPGLTVEQLSADGQRCSTVLIEKGSKLQEIGSELQQAGKEGADEEGTGESAAPGDEAP